MGKVRKSAVAGMFYPENPEELEQQIKTLLNLNKVDEKFKDVVGIVAPHAGYIYSGKSAACAYNVLKDNTEFETVIILSPSHHEYFEGSSIYSGDAYKTPLGNVNINKAVAQYIVDNTQTIFFGEEGHREEHALEVQLPFLQVISEYFDIVPIVIGDQSVEYLNELSNVLSEIIDDKTIIIASSDLSHFYSKSKASELDNKIVNRINNFEYPELYNDLVSQKSYACGGGGIVALMETADIIGHNKAEVLSHTDSGDVTNDDSSVVGYLSAVIYGGEE